MPSGGWYHLHVFSLGSNVIGSIRNWHLSSLARYDNFAIGYIFSSTTVISKTTLQKKKEKLSRKELQVTDRKISVVMIRQEASGLICTSPVNKPTSSKVSLNSRNF